MSAETDHAAFLALAERVLGLQWRARLARGTGLSYAYVKRFGSGDRPAPPCVVAVLELLEVAPRARWPTRWIDAVISRRKPGWGPPPDPNPETSNAEPS